MRLGRLLGVKEGDVTPVSRPSEEAIREELERLLASAVFAKSVRHRRFLTFVVDRVLAGEGDQLKEWTLATEVFDRPATYDSKVDTVVRVEARRLRAKLEEYYAGAGAVDPVRLILPKGSYAVEFEWVRAPEPTARRRIAGLVSIAALVGLAMLVMAFTRVRSAARVDAALASGRRNSEQYFQLRKPESFEAAERLLRQALAEAPRSPGALTELGLLYGRRYQITGQGEWRDRAQEFFQRAVAIDACQATANAVLSSIAREYGDFDRAVEIGRRAVSCDAASAQAHNALGLTWLYMGFYEAAEGEFRTAVNRDGTFLSGAINLAESLIYQDRLDEARTATQKALTIEPLSLRALLTEANLDQARNNEQAADSAWKRILQVAPEEMAPVRALFVGIGTARRGNPRPALEAVRGYRKAAGTGGLLWSAQYVRACLVAEEFGIVQECLKSDPHFQEYRGLISAPELRRFADEPGWVSLLEQKYDRWQRELKKYGSGLSPAPPRLPSPEEHFSTIANRGRR